MHVVRMYVFRMRCGYHIVLVTPTFNFASLFMLVMVVHYENEFNSVDIGRKFIFILFFVATEFCTMHTVEAPTKVADS
jgi:hypothetical protein